jgi:hypothetical protein
MSISYAGALGGTWVLPQASCQDCERKINSFETKSINFFFESGIPLFRGGAKRGKKRLKSFRVDVGTSDHDLRPVKVSNEQYPAFLMMLEFYYPSVLSGIEGPYDHSMIMVTANEMSQRANALGHKVAMNAKYDSIWIRRLMHLQ